MSVFARLATPLVWLVDRSTTLVLAMLGIRGETGGHGIHTVQELKDVVMESRQGGVIEAGEQQMLMRALEFSDRFVREAMIPRPDIIAVERTAPWASFCGCSARSGTHVFRVRRRPGPHRWRVDDEKKFCPSSSRTLLR